MKHLHIQQNKGMTVFIAVVLVSVILASSLTLIGISVKGFKIATDSRDSVYAIYAADSGIECALLWDVRGVELTANSVFATSSDSVAPAGPLGCFGVDILTSSWAVVSTPSAATTTYQFQFTGTGTYCSIVSVSKSPYSDGTGPVIGVYRTNILARGYDSACASISAQSVERAIRVQYP